MGMPYYDIVGDEMERASIVAFTCAPAKLRQTPPARKKFRLRTRAGETIEAGRHVAESLPPVGCSALLKSGPRRQITCHGEEEVRGATGAGQCAAAARRIQSHHLSQQVSTCTSPSRPQAAPLPAQHMLMAATQTLALHLLLPWPMAPTTPRDPRLPRPPELYHARPAPRRPCRLLRRRQDPQGRR